MINGRLGRIGNVSPAGHARAMATAWTRLYGPDGARRLIQAMNDAVREAEREHHRLDARVRAAQAFAHLYENETEAERQARLAEWFDEECG